MIHILLASYNGEQFIEEQIESLLNQTHQNFRVFINDDNSTDSTYSILQGYARQYPAQIFISRSGSNTGSPKFNFIRMMLKHKGNYVMLCDQDDVWLPDKIEKSVNALREMERLYGADTPILIHSDLKIVDKELKTISESLMRSMKADYSRVTLNSLIIQNTLAGCTAIYNRALAGLLVSEPEYMVMHDWWLALVAGAFGKIGTIYEPTMLYRQHGNNDVGAREMRSLKFIASEIIRSFHSNQVLCALGGTYRQAASFLEAYDGRLGEEQKHLLRTYAAIPEMNKLKRILTVCKLGTLKHGFIRKAAQFLFI